MLTTHKKGSEDKLMEIANSVKDKAAEYSAVHLRFSDLLEHYKTDYQLKISVNIINDLMREAKGSIVVTSDYDIFVICRNVDLKIIKKLIFQLRYLYMDDPLAYNEIGEDNEDFSRTFILASEWTEFFAAIRAKLKVLQTSSSKKPVETKPQNLTPEKLVIIEALIGKTNIAPALRQQPICFASAGEFRAMFTETYVNIGALNDLLPVNVDFGSNRWLFKYFTELLDLRVIELIKRTPGKYLRKASSFNFNVETLLSDVFADFARKLEPAVKKNIVIEIQVADVFTNMSAFQAAREIVQSHGFRLCLDGMDSLSFRQLDRNALGFDLAKMFWNADLKTDAKSEENKLLQKAIDECGKARIILCRCDTAEAIDYGKSLGISLFQGRYLDSIIDPEADFKN